MRTLSERPPTTSAALVSRRPTADAILSIRVLLVLGFGTVFVLWLASGFVLVRRMMDADARGAEIRQRFLENDQALSSISNRTLQTSMMLGDALLDPAATANVSADLLQARAEIDKALDAYELRDSSNPEGEAWYRLAGELEAYWGAVLPMVADAQVEAPAARTSHLASQVMPKRQAIMRILDQIHKLNEIAFREEQEAVVRLRVGLRRQVWQASAIAVLLGMLVAGLAIRHAGRLERRIHEQHALEAAQRTELERLSKKLMAAQEDERRRIARELHDETTQQLTALGLQLDMAVRQGETGARLAPARELVNSMIDGLHRVIYDLRPSMLDDLGLLPAIREYARVHLQSRGVTVHCECADDPPSLDADVQTAVYRVVQEALTNVMRHAHAEAVQIACTVTGDSLTIEVEDDGVGFDPDRVSQPRSTGEGLGLLGMRERLALLGGTIDIDAAPGSGTRVTVSVPLQATMAPRREVSA